jgi:hypothetical protein
VISSWSAESLISILSGAGMGVVLYTVIEAAREIARKKQAEAALVEILQHKLEMSIKLKRATKSAKAKPDDELVRLYEQQIESALRALSEQEQREILEALHQPSSRGRDNYIRKILQQILHHSGPTALIR